MKPGGVSLAVMQRERERERRGKDAEWMGRGRRVCGFGAQQMSLFHCVRLDVMLLESEQ
jgi:hypothetical protein